MMDILSHVIFYLFWAGMALLLYLYVRDRPVNTVRVVGVYMVGGDPIMGQFEAEFGPRRRR